MNKSYGMVSAESKKDKRSVEAIQVNILIMNQFLYSFFYCLRQRFPTGAGGRGTQGYLEEVSGVPPNIVVTVFN